MKSKMLVRTTFAAMLTLFAAGCGKSWVEGDAPEVPRGSFIEDKVEVPVAMTIPETPGPDTVVEGTEPIPPEEKIQQENASDIKYVVQKNDTLSSIASVYGIDQQYLAFRNGIKQPYALQPGQIIFIPVVGISNSDIRPLDSVTGYEAPSRPLVPEGATKPTNVQKPVAGKNDVVHVVKSGEMLGVIAQKYHVKQAVILSANNLTNPNKIRVGQKLIIPGGALANVPATKTTAKPVTTAKAAPAGKSVSKKPSTNKKDEPTKVVTTKVTTKEEVKETTVASVPATTTSSTPQLTDLTDPEGTSEKNVNPATEPVAPVVEEKVTVTKTITPAPAASSSEEVLTMPMKAGTKLKDYAISIDVSVEKITKLNPGIDPDVAVTEDTMVNVPID